MASVLGVPVAIVLVVVVVAVLPRLMPAGRRVDVRVLVLMHAVVRVVDHPGYLLHRPSRRLSEAHSPCYFLVTDSDRTTQRYPLDAAQFLLPWMLMCLTCGCIVAHLHLFRSNICCDDLKA